MKRYIFIFFIFLLSSPVYSEIKWWEFTFSGEDLMNYTIFDGADGSKPVELGIFSGAMTYVPVNTGTPIRSYQASTNDAFETWATTSGDKVWRINLWGYNGAAASYGESYKVWGWNCEGSAVPGWSSDSNWVGEIGDWSPAWGQTPANNNGKIIRWINLSGYDSVFGFGDDQYPTFTFRLGLDEDDPFFGSGGWYEGQEGKLVFWFGSQMFNSSQEYTGSYQGNFILQGIPSEPVPEPSSVILYLFGFFLIPNIMRKIRTQIN